MQILKSGYSVSPANYSKPTPIWIKIVGDIFFAIGALGSIAMPEFKGKEWVIFGCLACKAISKFISDHIPSEVPKE
jgi:hypothetical protein